MYLHRMISVDLNSVINKTGVRDSSYGKEKTLLASVVQLAISVLSMSEISLGQTKAVIALLGNEKLHKPIKEEFEKRCPSLNMMNAELRFIFEKFASGSDSVAVLHNVNELVKKFGKILSWEMVISLYAIDMDDSIDKQEVGGGNNINYGGENKKDEKKCEKKNKKTLGRGTTIVRQILID
ncbi:hypothetical protein KSP40_PGU007232 [Platanthera guangdongensis]|uniref:Uncharacterized protein n=1 Tax=Platanthera guangdongensis TaxID=2320717 RepID=A0ABR2MS40_9ASPA